MSYCVSYCSHGGVCILDAGHEGQHDSDYCQWGDSEALDKTTADALFYAKAGVQGIDDFSASFIADNT